MIEHPERGMRVWVRDHRIKHGPRGYWATIHRIWVPPVRTADVIKDGETLAIDGWIEVPWRRLFVSPDAAEGGAG